MKKFILKTFFLIAFVCSSFSLNAQNAKDIKKPAKCSEEEYCVAILGGGVGALTSGIYLSRAGYKPVIIEGNTPGGMITQSHSVENWPGEVKISGIELMDRVKNQAEVNGCKIISKEVVDVDFSSRPFKITVKDLFRNKTEVIKARSCIIAMGTSSNYINVPGEKNYWGRGVSNCAVCDGSLYENKNVVVVGGGDSAVLEANYLSNIAKNVYVVVRKDKLSAKDLNKVKALEDRQNINVVYNSVLSSINGDDELVHSIKLKNNKTNKESVLNVDGIFLATGSTPNTKIFKDKLQLDEKGYIKVKDGGQTSVEGVYAIGDIVDPIYKQAITAAGDGAKAAISAQNYLEGFKTVKNEKKDYLVSPVLAAVYNVETMNQFEKEVYNTKIPVVVDFYATWCKPCQRLAPVLHETANKLSGKVKILKVNVDTSKEIASKYKISAMPTAVVFDKSGNMLYKKIGPSPIADLLYALEDKKDNSVDEINNFLKNY
ncbi:MAG: FAD-dependent oxidoreductase [Parachlamydiales bacterium]|nr:FAD-dependent oxidoreductase [Parachlamydiales bacterium]